MIQKPPSGGQTLLKRRGKKFFSDIAKKRWDNYYAKLRELKKTHPELVIKKRKKR